MQDHELKALWKSQAVKSAPPLSEPEQLGRMKARMNCLNRSLFWRDCRENLAAVFVIAVFGCFMFSFPAPISRAGSAIVILSALLVMLYPIWRKRRAPKAAPDAPMMDLLKCELHRTEVEIALLRSILWWYILPLSVGIIVFHAGRGSTTASTIQWTLFLVAFDATLYWINQIVCDKKLVPLKRDIESLLDSDGTVPSPEPPRRYLMAKIILIISTLLFLGSVMHLIGGEADMRPSDSVSDPTSQMLEAIRVRHKLPALAVAVVVDGKIVATNAVGFRRLGGAEAVTVDDKFHIGSITKSMTATVAAMLVEQGKISWTTTIGESFSNYVEHLHPDYRGVTLEQLLAHRGGAPGNAPKDLWSQAWNASGPASEQRLKFVQGLLARGPETKPDTRHIYSNQGYSIAAVMLEKASGKPWEELMQAMLFEPLGMTSAGFGAPATPGKVDQPWGHRKGLFGGIQPVPSGPRADNPPAIGPAGTVHCSLPDLAHYVAFHLAGEREGSELLRAESFKKLHTPPGDDYALGWVVLERRWAGGRALMHNGSNTMFYMVVWMAPERNCAVIVAANIGLEEAFAGCDEAAGNLIEQFFPK